MADSLKYVGLGARSHTLIVYVDVVVGGVNYAREVKVPFSEFARDEIQYEVNLAVAHKLRMMWESEPPPWAEELPLPGIG